MKVALQIWKIRYENADEFLLSGSNFNNVLWRIPTLSRNTWLSKSGTTPTKKKLFKLTTRRPSPKDKMRPPAALGIIGEFNDFISGETRKSFGIFGKQRLSEFRSGSFTKGKKK